jgi:DNA-binding NarL/FixJ family response regulator
MSTSEAQPIRVLLIDDHDVVRVGLRVVIESRPHLKVVAEARNRDEALEALARTSPDIVLLDVHLDGEDGIDLLPALFATSNAQIILITGDPKPESHRRAVRLGVKGLVLKDHATETVANAIEQVHAGSVWLEPELISDVLNDLARPPYDMDASSKRDLLTPREHEVVSLVSQGLKNLQIANHLSISEATVRHHLTSIFSKLGINDRVELVIYAYKHGLTPPQH